MKKKKTTEIPAENIKGVLIRDIFSNEWVFRVYKDNDIKDYDLKCWDIEVTINDKALSLYEDGKLDYKKDYLKETDEDFVLKQKNQKNNHRIK